MSLATVEVTDLCSAVAVSPIPGVEILPEDIGGDGSDIIEDSASGEAGCEDRSPVRDRLDLRDDPDSSELASEIESSDSGEEADGGEVFFGEGGHTSSPP